MLAQQITELKPKKRNQNKEKKNKKINLISLGQKY
jgi:hypothetical protein